MDLDLENFLPLLAFETLRAIQRDLDEVLVAGNPLKDNLDLIQISDFCGGLLAATIAHP